MKVIKDYEIRFEAKKLSDLPQLRKLLEENNMVKPNFSELARNLNKSRNTVKRKNQEQLGLGDLMIMITFSNLITSLLMI